MASQRRTIFLSAVAVIGLVGLAVYAFRPVPVAVDLSAVTTGPMQITINADGRTQIKNVYEISAPFAGMAQRSPVRVGDHVKMGETVVAIVEPIAPTLLDERSRLQAEAAVREAEAAVHVAESELLQAQEDVVYAQSQFDRSKKLVDRGVASLTHLEDAAQVLAIKTAALRAAESRLEMAQGSVERSRAALIIPNGNDETTLNTCCVGLRAPADGVVLSVAMISARPVQAGTKLVSIGQPDDLEIRADLLSADALRLAPGARALIDRWGGDAMLEARLRSIEPAAFTKVSALGIEEQRVDVLFDLISTPAERPGLGDGYAVFLRIVEWQGQDIVQVPLSSLFRHNSGWAVFTAVADSAHLTPVTIGKRNSVTAQVLDGLEPGELVITHPSDLVADGVSITDRSKL